MGIRLIAGRDFTPTDTTRAPGVVIIDEAQRAAVGLVATPSGAACAMATLGACALLLAAIGIYSVLSYVVTERRAEIGVRMAVGASPSEVARLILSDGLRPVLVGLAAGLLIAAGVRDVLAAVVFGLADFDSTAYAAAALCLVTAAAAACLLPTLRTAREDPARVLRSTRRTGSGGYRLLRAGALAVVQAATFRPSILAVSVSIVSMKELDVKAVGTPCHWNSACA